MGQYQRGKKTTFINNLWPVHRLSVSTRGCAEPSSALASLGLVSNAGRALSEWRSEQSRQTSRFYLILFFVRVDCLIGEDCKVLKDLPNSSKTKGQGVMVLYARATNTLHPVVLCSFSSCPHSYLHSQRCTLLPSVWVYRCSTCQENVCMTWEKGFNRAGPCKSGGRWQISSYDDARYGLLFFTIKIRARYKDLGQLGLLQLLNYTAYV